MWAILLLMRMNAILLIRVWWRGHLFLYLNTWVHKREANLDFSFLVLGQAFLEKRSSSSEQLMALLELCVFTQGLGIYFFSGVVCWWALADEKAIYREKEVESLFSSYSLPLSPSPHLSLFPSLSLYLPLFLPSKMLFDCETGLLLSHTSENTCFFPLEEKNFSSFDSVVIFYMPEVLTLNRDRYGN